MPAASLFRPHPELRQPESMETITVTKEATTTERRPSSLRVVHFKETVSVRRVRHLNDTSQEEMAKVWYNKAEYDRMRRNMIVTVKMLMVGICLESNDKDYCGRGLEHRTRAGASRRKVNKTRANDAVLEEQDRQRARGMMNTEAMRQVYIQANLLCRLAAFEMGVNDRDEARLHLLEEEEQADSDDDYSSADEMDYCVMLGDQTSRSRAIPHKGLLATDSSSTMAE